MVRSTNSIRYYRKYYTLISIAVIIMMAVLSGSLLLGDSVRGTLVDRVNERLGSTETIITSGSGFLDEQIMHSPILKQSKGYLVCEGFVSAGSKLLPVNVWATDNDSIKAGNAIVNEPLGRRLEEEDFVLHLPSHSLVPSGSLFVTQKYSTQLRLHKSTIRSVEAGGNLSLRNEQSLPLNVFMNRNELASIMQLEGKLNLIMCPTLITDDEFASVWTPKMSGININGKKITSDRIFIAEQQVNALPVKNILFSYLVNDIYNTTDSIPYSFVTAVRSWKNKSLNKDGIILSDYASIRLNANIGDTISMDYYVTKGSKSLTTRSHRFTVQDIVPLQDFKEDSILMTDFPGLSNVEKCTDWDSDLPIDMHKIAKEDEDFWYKYRNTPKALVSYDAIKNDWTASFGVATAIELSTDSNSWNHKEAGVQIINPREAGIYAANNGTDFSSLFLALGFFIILSAILLMQNPLVEMLIQRKQEIELLLTLGYSKTLVYKILIKEIGIVVLCSSPFGILAGIMYSGITLFLLGNVWSGATHTEGFALHISVPTLLISFISGIIVCALTVMFTIRSFSRDKNRKSAGNRRNNNRRLLTVIAGIATVSLFLVNIIHAHSIILFVCCGLLWLFTAGMLLTSVITFKAEEDTHLSVQAMQWKTLASQRRSVLLSFWSLAIGVFTVFAVGLNRPDLSHSSEDGEMTGQYHLWCECRVPMEYDLNNEDVRRKLHLQDLDSCTRFMQILQYTQDEASCLNLNRVATPTVLGIDPEELHNSFGVDTEHITSVASISNAENTVYPILIDSESLTWSLMKSVGDTLDYKDGNGKDIRLLIAGTYPTGIFHGNAIMNKELFRKLWSEETGSRILLVRTREDKVQDTQDLLENVLSEYGCSITTTTERIEMFFTVTDTYLAIFLTLGGLGLILGVFCLIIIVRKNIASRQTEITTLMSLGFRQEDIIRHLTHENMAVPLYAVIAGSIGSVISISANISGAGLSTILIAIFFLVALIILVYYGIKHIINTYNDL